MGKTLKYGNLKEAEDFSTNDLYEFISSQEHYFEPNLSYKVNLRDYAEKLSNLATVNICFYESKIVGVCAFYCTPDIYDYGFLSFLSVESTYRNRGIAKKMVQDMIEHCRHFGMKTLKSSTWKSSKAMRMYMNLGFKATYSLKDESVLLDLEL
ncbi:GNAT family N-acetyltransferase [Tamlana sp. 2201CG12-4]|uniref:GNAT family N-acetyltransferase n=1 Tax=Tamlana sp. 2201CG12-4 TaxID=3112582 RepID=UPI002DB8A90B|nr:GNAT family N-acetyltransferase [Tamlana sp. 2201CG12-4]MEC3907601.1 GNAT family N-acetyltransferase [Tamlana sp. 2201CG12-4]